MSPAYDLLNTTIPFWVLGKPSDEIEEVALPLKGRKNALTAAGWLRYYASERLGINQKVLSGLLDRFKQAKENWPDIIQASFLPYEQKELYQKLMHERFNRLQL